jgi:hypothetical protein
MPKSKEEWKNYYWAKMQEERDKRMHALLVAALPDCKDEVWNLIKDEYDFYSQLGDEASFRRKDGSGRLNISPSGASTLYGYQTNTGRAGPILSNSEKDQPMADEINAIIAASKLSTYDKSER